MPLLPDDADSITSCIPLFKVRKLSLSQTLVTAMTECPTTFPFSNCS